MKENNNFQTLESGITEKKPEPTALTNSRRIYSTEYLLIVSLATFSLVAALILQGAALDFFRNSFGVLLALWLPGYCLVRAVFVWGALPFARHNRSDWLLTAAFSMVFSIVLVALVAFGLDFVPWGINLQSLTLSLSLLTILFATIAAQRRRSRSE